MALGSSSGVDTLDAAMAGAGVEEDLALTMPLCEHPFQVAGEGALFGLC
jgi:hypothetical protein